MANLLKVLYEVVWTEEGIPKQLRQGLIIKKGDAEDPGNYSSRHYTIECGR